MRPKLPFRIGVLDGLSGLLLALFVVAWPSRGSAQWLTQTLRLNPGWNAVFLHVDATHTNLNFVEVDLSNPIQEIWMWRPSASTAQFFQNPQEPNGTGTQWSSWTRANPDNATLGALVGDMAYLVFVGGTQPYSWNVVGKPVPPSNRWSGDGQNFVGFSVPGTGGPTFEQFLSPVPEFKRGLEVFYYPGGESGSPVTQRLFPFLFASRALKRGEAYWMRNPESFNRYFGAFDLALPNNAGLFFKDSVGQTTFRIRNQTSGALTVTARFLPSEDAPVGQTTVVAAPPLLLRGKLNTTNLSYGYTSFPVGSSMTWTLASSGALGSDLEVVLGVNRALMSAAEGSFYGGILRFTDSLGYSQMDVPVSAIVPSSAGLWVGAASVTHVGHYLQSYAKATNDLHLTSILSSLGIANGNGTNYLRDAATGLIIAQTATSGAYLSTNIVRDSGKVTQPVTLRLIVHSPGGNGSSRLLQRAFFGVDKFTNTVVATSESVLHPAMLSQARRITAAHLPWSASNLPWSFNGRLRADAGITAEIITGYDDHASNPFLHTYHPDHDNLDATFKTKLPVGQESYEIRRSMTLNRSQPPDDFVSLTTSGGTVSGTYVETVTLVGLANTKGGREQRQFVSSGVYLLQRISDIGILTTP